MKKIDDFSTESNEDRQYTHNTSSNTGFIGIPLEYHDRIIKSIESNDFDYEFSSSIFRTSMCDEKLLFTTNSSIKSNSEFDTHSRHSSIHENSYLSEKDLNQEQECSSISIENSTDSLINVSKGTIFCSNTSLDSTLNYSTLEDSTNIANEPFIELQNSSTYENQSNNNSGWINQKILYDYQELKTENYGILEDNTENIRQSLFFLSPWEIEDDNLKLKCKNLNTSSNLLLYSGNSLNESRVVESRITESTPENPEFTLNKSNVWSISVKENKNTLNDARDSDKCNKSPDIAIESSNVTNCKLHIFHKSLKPLGPKSMNDNLDIGLYLIIKQGGIDSNGAKYILLDPQIKTSIHYKGANLDLDKSWENNQDFKKWYDLQLGNLYKKYNSNSPKTQTPSVSHLAKFVDSVEWSRRESVKEALEAQKNWNPFSIFGSAPPFVHLPDIFDYNFYKNFAPLQILKTNAVFKGLCNMEQINIENGLKDCDWPIVRSHLESRWRNQASLDCDWRCDELEINEVFWYLNVMEKCKDRSNSVYTLEPCYCVTPDPQLGKGLMWNDPRCNPIYPRPSLYNSDHLELLDNKPVLELGETNSEPNPNREINSLSLDDLPDTPEMTELEVNDRCQIENNLNVYGLPQISMCPYRRHGYMDQPYQLQYQQYHSPFGTLTYPSQTLPVTQNASTSLYYGSVGIGKRRKGLHQYDYQPARVKHKLNMFRNY